MDGQAIFFFRKFILLGFCSSFVLITFNYAARVSNWSEYANLIITSK